MTPPRPSALLFDWDNTLVDAWAGVTAALNTTFDAFGLPRWTDEDTRQRARLALGASFRTMLAQSPHRLKNGQLGDRTVDAGSGS